MPRFHRDGRGGVFALATMFGVFAVCCPLAAEMNEYQTRYYVICTDHDMDMVKEASARLTAMAEEYHERTKDFAGNVRRRLPFYLFSTLESYQAAGGVGAGVYRGDRLMAYTPKGGGGNVWHVVQHEGFHQFVHMVIRGRIPTWVNEGLAEYFGEGIWTGDNFVTGVIPPGRLRRVKALIQSEKMKSFYDMLTMSGADWVGQLDVSNYDQAWSMVQFLVHAEDGKYMKLFASFLKDISSGTPYEKAFQARFGRDIKAFQKKYADWWSALPDNPTQDRYTLAVCQTLTSFFARAYQEGQKFGTAEEFLQAASAGALKSSSDEWLPPGLLAPALASAKRIKTWSIDTTATPPRIVLTQTDGTVYVGRFTHQKDTGFSVQVETRIPKPKSAVAEPSAGKEQDR